ncbi:NAD(P)-dependent oxidoreductase [Deinococcus detaillensis]|uniref:NAD(P)-dependent oxidoreductase n=1 Tax=Deinococcus detaillensis TaxID=2592048 RepID=A0A553UNE7_9DEIO|nr:NAD(P)-dependent oxidoreductase [Deinococcus detaillensis]TSA81733.1 NAD(P)-dependent oxidoreductase [Deinococcus detaillensis]
MTHPPPIFLTGAGGFVGRALIQHWREAGVPVIGADLSGADEVIDVLNAEQLCRRVAEIQPRAVVHAAALTSGSDLRLLEVNLGGTLNALNAALQAEVKHFVLLSSTGVYSPQVGPISETGQTTSANAYSLSKVLAERAAAMVGGEMSIWSLRLGPVYGAGEEVSGSRQRTSLIHQIAAAIREQRSVNLSQGRDSAENWLHTRDLVRLLNVILAQSESVGAHLYNVAGPPVSQQALLEAFEQLCPEQPVQKWLTWNPTPLPRHGEVDCCKVAQELDFRPTIPLLEGLFDALAAP